ncbi:hypothetical protein H9Q74_005546 [Fusarium xylarioides]|nr:hypothetical protein H9Q71_011502 [Fusarium xylarioides]KAG5824369.1 hypothetical protein H9Q74_005546 [Fusarium xylarioides]
MTESQFGMAEQQEEDWVFSCSGLAYNTGKPGRTKSLVIKVRHGTRISKESIETFSTLDTEVSQDGFDNGEVNFDMRTTNIKDLALVAGECFEKDDDEILDEHYLKNTPHVTSVQTFDREIHAHIGIRGSGYILRLVKDESKRVRYFALKNKQNGLCELKPLCSMNYHFKKCMFYSEFVVG